MNQTQKYNTYNRQNLTAVLVQAQGQKQLVNHLFNIKGVVDTRKPRDHINQSQKNFKRENDKQMKIDHENTVLLQKIMGIMKRKNKSVMQARSQNITSQSRLFNQSNDSKTQLPKQEAVKVKELINNEIVSQESVINEHQNIQNFDYHQKGGAFQIQPVLELNSQILNTFASTFNTTFKMRGSLNQASRKRELTRINKQNQNMLQKLQEVKPSIGSVRSWKQHQKKFEQVRGLRKIGDTGQKGLCKIDTSNRERSWNTSVYFPVLKQQTKPLDPEISHNPSRDLLSRQRFVVSDGRAVSQQRHFRSPLQYISNYPNHIIRRITSTENVKKTRDVQDQLVQETEIYENENENENTTNNGQMQMEDEI